jgi:hypothetical protein
MSPRGGLTSEAGYGRRDEIGLLARKERGLAALDPS